MAITLMLICVISIIMLFFFFFFFGLFEVVSIIFNDKVPSRFSGLQLELVPCVVIPEQIQSQIIASDVHFVQPMTAKKKHLHQHL